jgi:hypothetical protein
MTDDKLKKEFEQLKKDVFSDDWELVKSSADRLGQIGGDEVVAYESKISAYAILSDQIFDFTKDDLHEIQKMWEDCKLHPDKCPGFDDTETREMMQDAVDGFLSYLNPKPTAKMKSKKTGNAQTKKKPSS